MNELDAIIAILQGARQDLQESNLRAFIASLRRFHGKVNIGQNHTEYFDIDDHTRRLYFADSASFYPESTGDPYQDYYRECRAKTGGGVNWVGD